MIKQDVVGYEEKNDVYFFFLTNGCDFQLMKASK